MKVSMNKNYRTRDGRPVKILFTNRPHIFSVIAMTYEGMIITTTKDGFFLLSKEEDKCDLIEVTKYAEWEIDTKVEVLLYGRWVPRYFAGITENGMPSYFVGGRTSYSNRNHSGGFCKDARPIAVKDCNIRLYEGGDNA